MNEFNMIYAGLHGIAWAALIASYAMAKKTDPHEDERAEFRSQSWPSAPGQDVFSTGEARKYS